MTFTPAALQAAVEVTRQDPIAEWQLKPARELNVMVQWQGQQLTQVLDELTAQCSINFHLQEALERSIGMTLGKRFRIREIADFLAGLAKVPVITHVNLDELSEVLHDVLGGQNWDSEGFGIWYFNDRLVIRQNRAMHHAIYNFLTTAQAAIARN